MPLNHVGLTVGDRHRSAAFYVEHFGLTQRVHDDEHLLILGSPDGSLLALIEGPVPSGLPRGNHFGFQLTNPDEVRAARDRLREAGAPETEWQDDDGFVRVQVSTRMGTGSSCSPIDAGPTSTPAGAGRAQKAESFVLPVAEP